MEKQVTVRDAIIAIALADIRDLFNDDFAEISKDAIRAFTDSEKKKEPKAKVTFSVTWNPNSDAPNVKSKIAWGTRKSAETENIADPAQIKLPLEETK